MDFLGECFKVWACTENFHQYGEVGTNLCVYVKGEKVLDLWGGMAYREDLGLRDTVKPDGFLDWDYMVERLAAEKPFWKPGSNNGYDRITFG